MFQAKATAAQRCRRKTVPVQVGVSQRHIVTHSKVLGSGDNWTLCPLREALVENYGFTSSPWAYLGRREGNPGEDPGASCLSVRGTSQGHTPPGLQFHVFMGVAPVNITLMLGILCGVALPFSRGVCVCPAGTLGCREGLSCPWLYQGTLRDSEPRLTVPFP